MEELYKLYYILYIIDIFIIVGIINKNNLFNDMFILMNNISSKRLQLFTIGMIGGILPIPGRVITISGLIDTLVIKTSKSYSKLGIFTYLSSHHYYLWSPLEKTVILPMAALNISYTTFLYTMLPIIIITLLFIIIYIFFIIKEDDIELKKTNIKFNLISFIKGSVPILVGIILMVFDIEPALIFTILTIYYIIYTKTGLMGVLSFIKWDIILILTSIILLSIFLGNGDLFIYNDITKQDLFYTSIGAVIASFALGSSAKYAGISSILLSIYGIDYMIWFLTIEFIAYNLSPMHKCIYIGKMYFNTSIKEYFKIIIIWQLSMFIYALFTLELLQRSI